jgi:hypothetical protein
VSRHLPRDVWQDPLPNLMLSPNTSLQLGHYTGVGSLANVGTHTRDTLRASASCCG